MNPLTRLAARLRLAAALKAADPPASESLTPLYAEALQDTTLDDATRARICRAITYADGSAGRYVEAWIPLYIEAACAFSDDPRCVLFVLSLLHVGAINARAALSFSQGVYAAALFFESWENGPIHTAFGLPPYAELRRELALLYAAEPNFIAPERTAVAEAAYEELECETGDVRSEDLRAELAAYLVRAYQVSGRDDDFTRRVQDSISRWQSAPVPGKRPERHEDPLDDPEVILRGGSGNPEDDLRIARRYIEERREFDSAACALFSRCARNAKERRNVPEAAFWSVKLAHALIAVGRVDGDTRELFRSAAAAEPDDALLELAFLYSYVIGGDHEQTAGETELLRRLENAVLTLPSRFTPVAEEVGWDWGAIERHLALTWGHRGRADAYARSLYKKVTEADPGDPLLAVLYARSLAQANVTDSSAIAAYEAVMSMGKANEPVRRALAIAYAKAGAARDDAMRPQALLLWEEMHRSGLTDNADIVSALAEAYAREDKSSDVAIAIWEKAAKAEPKNGTLRLRLAREMRKRGEMLEATALYKEAALLLPDDFETQYETGVLLSERNDAAGAIRFLKKAVNLGEGVTHKEAHFALGEALLAAAKRDEAVQVFDKILNEMDSDHAPTLLQMAKLSLRYEESGAKRAEHLYGKALSLDASNPEGYRRLALLHEEQGRYSDAEAAWEQYLAHSPPDAESSRKIADLYLKRGDFVKAEAALRQTLALGGNDKKLFGLLGEVIVRAQMQREGKSPEARIKAPDAAGGVPKTRRIAPRKTPAPEPAAAESSAAAGGASPAQAVPVPADVAAGTSSAAAGAEPDSPASQNLTRSAGAAAIKATLRNRAARLSSPAPEDNAGS